MYINLIFQFILLFVPILSNDISLYHNSLKYLYITWAISFFYIILLTIRDVFYYMISGMSFKKSRKGPLIEKIEGFFKNARSTWNMKMNFLPGKLSWIFQIEMAPFSKIIMNLKKNSIFLLMVQVLVVSEIIYYLNKNQRIHANIKLFHYTILFFIIYLGIMLLNKFVKGQKEIIYQ